MSLARFAYSAILVLLTPAALARLWWRGRREPDYRMHIGERFGRYAPKSDCRPLIWLHAVSVGETRAAEPVVRALLERHCDHQILLTHTTPTGRSTGEALLAERVRRVYLPYDSPSAVARFLDHFAPRIGILMETEIWPNLIHGCRSRGIPIYLANARLSERSYRGYLRFAPLARGAFGALAGVAAQTPDDAARLNALGARNVHVTGNVKFDVSAPCWLLELGRTWRRSHGDRRILLAASTREGEEALLLDALPLLADDVLLVLVPRHPQRFDDVAALLASRGISYARRSAPHSGSGNLRVLLGDSLGEMPAYYAACDAAFVGGSLLPFGGQNFIEGCAVGKPVLIGPHTYNFADAAAKAIEAGAALRVQTAEELMGAAMQLLNERKRLESMSARAVEFTRAHRGATERVLQMIESGLSSVMQRGSAPPQTRQS